MSYYGKNWEIDGVAAGLILRESTNGRYRVIFEREYAELPRIESIDWSAPNVTALTTAGGDGLPAGYGFDLLGITYDSGTRSYAARLQVSRQFLGDVTGYQARIAQQDERIRAHEAAEAARAAEMEQAYHEGVESHG